MRAPRVRGLIDQGWRSGIVLVIIGQSLMRNNRIGKVFVEVTRLEQAGIIERTLVEDVVIVGVFGLEFGIPDAYGCRRCADVRLTNSRGHFLRIGAGQTPSVNEAKIGVSVHREANGSA